jgi:hypothetical protein
LSLRKIFGKNLAKLRAFILELVAKIWQINGIFYYVSLYGRLIRKVFIAKFFYFEDFNLVGNSITIYYLVE